ncbi:hypothetical protein FBQ85_16700 [Cytophagia bacterium CHB2]|nr:hypothetical protein [Cytophagia bacterium CHB2]
MKRHVQTIALALLWPATLLAQSEWSWQNPLPQGYTLYDLHIFDANTVLVVGEAATAIKTMDGGASWSLQHNLGGEGITVELESVSFVDANTGFAVGPGDRIFKTTDGGATWSVQSAGVFSTLHGVDFDKGCYVGQELTARMKHRGKVRKRLLPVRVAGELPPSGAPITEGGKEIGEMRGGLGARAIAYLRLDDLEVGKSYRCGAAQVTPERPAWLPDAALRPGKED